MPAQPDAVADLSLRIVSSLARCLREQHGADALAEVAAAAGLTPEELERGERWVPHEQFERVLARARGFFPSEDAFRRACAYKIAESYGPMRLLFWAVSPAMVLDQAAKHFPTISSISDMRVVDKGRTFVHNIYRSARDESREMCLSRQGQAVTLPQLWGLPPAQLEESRCIAWGDDCCEYHIRWHDTRRWLPILAGGAVGGLAWLALVLGLHFSPALLAGVLLPLSGLLLGYLFEQMRVNRSNLRYGEETRTALRGLAADSAAARQELLGLQRREQAWSRLMEEQLAERTARLQEMAAGIDKLQERRVVALRGLSHDIRNPMTVLRFTVDMLRERRGELDADSAELVDDQHLAIGRMERILREMLHAATAESELVTLRVQRIDTGPLADTLRRRLRALCHGREIKVSVFRTREAPEMIETDPLLLDRVIDNLLTNAAKYTRRGSIVVEISGTPGRLTLKVSDTGPGIDDDKIDAVFQPGGSADEDRAPDSYGVGLSVVVQLLARLGARMEVMSKPGLGTTFWVHFPVARPDEVETPPAQDLLERVLRIRRVESA